MDLQPFLFLQSQYLRLLSLLLLGHLRLPGQ
jgi:hypothetical protein